MDNLVFYWNGLFSNTLSSTLTYFIKIQLLGIQICLANFFFFRISIFDIIAFWNLEMAFFILFHVITFVQYWLLIHWNIELALLIAFEYKLLFEQWLLNHLKEVAIFELCRLNRKSSPGAECLILFLLKFSRSICTCQILNCIDVVLCHISPGTYALRNIIQRPDLIFIFKEAIKKRNQSCSLGQAGGKWKEEGNILAGNVFCLQTFFVFIVKAKIKIELLFNRFISGFIFFHAF